MILTKEYFKNFQYGLLIFCIVSAALIGSAQSLYIINKLKNRTASRAANKI